MTRPRRSTPGIAFAAVRTGRFETRGQRDVERPRRETLDILAVGRSVTSANRRRRVAGALGGAVLLSLALAQRGVMGGLLALGGAAVLVRSVSGRSLVDTARRVARLLHPGTKNERDDGVDRASEASFPASDPPAHSPS